jgi:very-short-patch-repair endonuclease
VDPSVTAAIGIIASTQHGLISAEQLIALGVTRSQLRTLIERRVLQRELPRVFAIPGAPHSVERATRAGLLCLGPTAVVSHEAAARLHRFDRSLPDAVEFSMPRAGRGREARLRIHTTSVLPAIDRVTVDGVPCTSATRTIIDLARARLSTVRLEAAVDSAVRSGASAPLVIARRLGQLRGPGRWGAPRLDALLLDSGGHTMLERRFLELVREGGLPRPKTQVVQRQGTRTVARVDFLWPDLGVVVEVSGRRGHASDAERARDAQRRNELQDMGMRVYEYTWDDVTRRRAHVVTTLCARLGQASGDARRSNPDQAAT